MLFRSQENNRNFGCGFIEHGEEQYTVRGMGRVDDADAIGRVVLLARAGTSVLVRDVATVVTGPVPRQGATLRDGKGETVSGMAIMLKGENGRDVAARVKARMAEVAAQLPKGLKIVPFYDQSEVIDRTTSTVLHNLLEGCALVILILVIFLRDLRASLIVAACARNEPISANAFARVASENAGLFPM